MTKSKKTIALVSFVILGAGIAIGFLVGYMVNTENLSDDTEVIVNKDKNYNADISKKLIDGIKAENIRENLRKLTEHPHLGGTPADLQQANDLKTEWEKQGYKTWLTSYRVMLSYPDKDNPNKIELQDGSGSPVYTTQLKEKILRPEQDQPDVVPPFNAFSAAGNPQGQLIYVNYGRIEDFTWLKNHKNMIFSENICIARYGKIFRGDKVKLGHRFGCAGMILYTDPKDYNMASVGQNVYPDSWWMPPTGVQRGTIKISSGGLGDPLTPGYPSIDSAYRINESDADLPKIPAHPISYGDAQALLQHMAGDESPEKWRGDLNITYRLGPGFQNRQWKVQMFINTRPKIVTVHNSFAMIRGSIEPDRYVLFGNHRDAWVFGAVDPSSGTAAMMELSRVIGETVRHGWKPRRSIIFCSWAAEEFGLIGSREWVEQYTSLLSARAVAYLNLDLVINGNYTFNAGSLPMIKETLYEVAKKIDNPDPEEVSKGRKKLYDTWRLRMKELDVNKQPTGKPNIHILGSGSDFAPFVTKLGMMCVNARFYTDVESGISTYPLYHSVYETFHLVNDIMDPGFVFHKAITQFWAELIKRLSDEAILPYDPRKYVELLMELKTALVLKYGTKMNENGLQSNLDNLENSINALREAVESFHQRLKSVDVTNSLQVRMVNDQLMSVDRVFIDPNGLPDRPFTRNVLFAPSAHDSYSGIGFPGIVDTLFGVEDLSGQEYIDRWEKVKQEMSIVTFYIQQAAALLQDYTDFQFQ